MTSDYEQGRLWWTRIKVMPFQSVEEYNAFAPSAQESAANMVFRLAPELEPRTEDLHTPMFSQVVRVLVDRVTNQPVAWAGGTLLQQGGECCAYTFNMLDPQDLFIPEWERALTFYLYKKLLPKRFAERPMERRHSW